MKENANMETLLEAGVDEVKSISAHLDGLGIDTQVTIGKDQHPGS